MDSAFSRDPLDFKGREATSSEIKRIRNWFNGDDEAGEDNSEAKQDLQVCGDALKNGTISQLESFVTSNSPDRDFVNNQNSASSFPSPTPSRVFFATAASRFREPDVLGAGGFGIVYKAFDTSLQIPVAIKILRPSKCSSSEGKRRFAEEARIVASLNHPGIVPIFETGSIADLPYMTSPHIVRGSLAKLLKLHSTRFTPRQAAWFIGQVVKAVHYAHTQGVLHRDLKPANILLAPCNDEKSHQLGFEPVITDFGLAKRLDRVGQLSSVTKDGKLLGTTRYMSPEHLIGSRGAIGTTSDIFSLGIILYEMVVGRVPFEGASELATCNLIAQAQPTRPRLAYRSIPVELEAVILKCLAKDPSDRYASAHELQQDIERFLRQEPVEAQKSTWWRRARYFVRKHPIGAAATAVTVVANLAALTGLAWALRHESHLLEREQKATLQESTLKQDALQAKTIAKETTRQMVDLFLKFADKVIVGKQITAGELATSLQDAIHQLEREVSDDPNDTRSYHSLSVLHHYACAAYQDLSQLDRAIEERKKVIELLNVLIDKQPTNQQFRYQKFVGHLSLGPLLAEKSARDSSSELRQQSIVELQIAEKVIEELANEYPDNAKYLDGLAAIKAELVGDRFSEDLEVSIRRLDESIAISKKIYLQYPERDFPLKYAIVGLMRKAEYLGRAKRLDEAFSAGKESLSLFNSVWSPFDGEQWHSRDGFSLYTLWIEIPMAIGDWDSALEASNHHQRYATRLLKVSTNESVEIKYFLVGLYRLKIFEELQRNEDYQAESEVLVKFVNERKYDKNWLDKLRTSFADKKMSVELREAIGLPQSN